jgi:hypothetical protein
LINDEKCSPLLPTDAHDSKSVIKVIKNLQSYFYPPKNVSHLAQAGIVLIRDGERKKLKRHFLFQKQKNIQGLLKKFAKKC